MVFACRGSPWERTIPSNWCYLPWRERGSEYSTHESPHILAFGYVQCNIFDIGFLFVCNLKTSDVSRAGIHPYVALQYVSCLLLASIQMKWVPTLIGQCLYPSHYEIFKYHSWMCVRCLQKDSKSLVGSEYTLKFLSSLTVTSSVIRMWLMPVRT